MTDHLLLLLRHSKAEAGPGKPDADRTLSHRGRRDAGAVGHWLAGHDYRPDLVVSSTSTRTRQTWEAAAAAGAAAGEVTFDRRVYNASPETLLEVVREVAEDVATLLVVGHAPGIPVLTGELADDGTGSAPEARTLLEEGFPTSGLAVLRCAGPWADLAGGGAVLVDFVAPRG